MAYKACSERHTEPAPASKIARTTQNGPNMPPLRTEPTGDGRVQMRGARRFVMRVLFGIILGGILTVGGAYLYDSHQALEAANAPASVQRPMVNWDVVDAKWQRLSERARSEWVRVAGR